MDWVALALFGLSATALLGSPGPGIAAIVSVGQTRGLAGSQPFFWGLQAGLALTAALSAAGLSSALAAMPFALTGLTFLSVAYLLWMAVQMIRAVPESTAAPSAGWSFGSGLSLGVTNPKSLVAFVSLFASQRLLPSSSSADTVLKWIVVVSVMMIVDAVWLLAGVKFGSMTRSVSLKRRVNLVLGSTVAIVALATLQDAL